MVKGSALIWKNLTILESVDQIMAVECEDICRLQCKIANLTSEIKLLKEKCEVPIDATNYAAIDRTSKLIDELNSMLDFFVQYKEIKINSKKICQRIKDKVYEDISTIVKNQSEHMDCSKLE